MNPSEIGVLAFGIALGVTVGAALLAVVRPRSPLRPVVRVTVTPNAMAPRSSGWPAAGGFARRSDPAPGSPDEDALLDGVESLPQGPLRPLLAAAPQPPEMRTRVPSPRPPPSLPAHAVGIAIVAAGQTAPGPVASAPAIASAGAVATAVRSGTATGAATAHSPAAELATALDIGPRPRELAVRPRTPVAEPLPSLGPSPTSFTVLAAAGSSSGPGDQVPASPVAAGRAAAADPCADERTAAAALCRAADAAREDARAAADRMRVAQRAHNALEAAVDEAAALADPRRLATEKERLHAAFTTAHGSARDPDEAEAAAREWLQAVSAANAAARDATLRAQRGTEDLRAQAAELEQLELASSGARITAERAEESCRSARESLAECEERQRSVVTVPAGEPGPLDGYWPGSPEPTFGRQSDESEDSDHLPAIVRVLRGDNAAREHLVAELAAGDAAAVAAWHVNVARFVDAVTARAIEDGYLDMPEDHRFWRLFGSDEQRNIVEALSSLGFRFDGLGGFVDERVPSARDLALAVGYAGLDRMRVRTWPGEAELAALFEGASIRADAWLAAQADDLALARVEAALGSRAEAMGDLWDAWGRVRPAMLAES